MPDGMLAPKCQDSTRSGFGLCMTDAKHPLFNTCVPPTGTVLTSCTAASHVSNLTTPEPGGPLIWGGQLVRAADCSAGTQRGYTEVVRSRAMAAPRRLMGGLLKPAIMFPCVNANPLPTSIAFVLVDTAGHKSNPLCLNVQP